MQDYMIRATAAEGTIRALAATTTGTVQEARDIHDLSGVASAALGRTLTAAALLSGMLKGERDVITIQVKGDGPLGSIIVVSDVNASVRGYVHEPHVYLPLNAAGKFDVGGAVGREGYLNVIKDIGMREPYIGNVKLVSGEIGEDIAYYLAYSEQVPSVVSLGTLVAPDESIVAAGGFIVQLMPGADPLAAELIEDRVQHMVSITSLLSQGVTPEEILDALLGDMELVLSEKTPVQYECNCTRERMQRGLISLGPQEIRDIIVEQHGAELQCHFCNKKYAFSEQELSELLEEI